MLTKIFSKHLTSITILVMLLLTNNLFAAGNVDDVVRYESLTLPNTEVRYLDSTQTHESYRIYVSIPAEYYQHPDKKYPAIFLLDADYSFPIVTAITNHLSDRNRIPPMFIFGIAYAGAPAYELHRTQDYTPTYVAEGGYGAQYQKVSGGASKFAAFLQAELIPYLNQSFRLNSQRTLVGHSFGGLFGSWSMLYNPTLFNSYIIISPSLWYDNNYLFKYESDYAKSHQQLPVNVFFGIGSKENDGDFKMIDGLNNYVKLLQQPGYKDFKSQYMILPNEDHDMIFPDAFTQGIMYLYGEK